MKKKPTKKKPSTKEIIPDLPEAPLETYNAKFVYSDPDRLSLAMKLAKRMQDLETLQNDKKAVVSDYGSRIKVVEADIQKMRNNYTAGFEFRDCECKVEFDWKKGTKHFIRTSDGQDVGTKEITAADRQMYLINEPKTAMNDAFKKAEEERKAKETDAPAESENELSEAE